VTVVLPDGWVDVPLDSAAFTTFVDQMRKDNADLAAELEKLHTTDAAALSVLALTPASDGTYKTYASVLVDKSGATSASALSSAVSDKLSAAVHDVSVTTGKIGGHDAVFATYDKVSALVPPQGGQVYVLGPDSVAVVTVTTYDSVNPLTLAKQIAATVDFG
jgi:hypothetical protein